MNVYLQTKPSGIEMQEHTDGTVSIAVTGPCGSEHIFHGMPDQRHSGRCGRCVVINVEGSYRVLSKIVLPTRAEVLAGSPKKSANQACLMYSWMVCILLDTPLKALQREPASYPPSESQWCCYMHSKSKKEPRTDAEGKSVSELGSMVVGYAG